MKIIETMTLTVDLVDSSYNGRDIRQVWIDKQEVATIGMTLPHLLMQIDKQGWHFGHATMRPHREGALISYFYDRPVQTM